MNPISELRWECLITQLYRTGLGNSFLLHRNKTREMKNKLVILRYNNLGAFILSVSKIQELLIIHSTKIVFF